MVERPCWERDWRFVSSRMSRGRYLWCCLNCGEYVDPTILFNRQQVPVDMTSRRHSLVWDEVRKRCKEVAA